MTDVTDVGDRDGREAPWFGGAAMCPVKRQDLHMAEDAIVAVSL